jgi:thiol-disulfide isomerase/thioredoxin
MVEFYADWCPACQKMEEIWNKFGDWCKYRCKGATCKEIMVGRVDITVSPFLTGRVMISNLPTIFHIKDGVWRDYGNKKRQTNNLRDFIKHKKWENIKPFFWLDPGKDVFRHMDEILNKIACCSISTFREPHNFRITRSLSLSCLKCLT